MYFENHLSDADADRAAKSPYTMSAPVLASAHMTQLDAIRIMASEYLVPIMRNKQEDGSRESIFVGLFYRSLGFARSALELSSPVHFQSLTSAARSLIEIYTDVELLHRNVIQDGVAKAIAFVDVQKVRAARRVDRFFREHPHLDRTPSKATPHRAFVQKNGVAIDAKTGQLWGINKHGKPKEPDHWSELSLPARAEKISEDHELLVLEGYDMRNFVTHTGLAGVAGLDRNVFDSLSTQSLNVIADCLLGQLRIIGDELNIYEHIPHYKNLLTNLEELRHVAFLDHALRAQGEPQRLFVHEGDPPQSQAST